MCEVSTYKEGAFRKKWPYFFLYMVEITKSISQQQHNMLLIYVLITKGQARHRRQKYLVSFLFWIWISVSQNIKFYIHHKNSFWGENFEKKTDDEWWYLWILVHANGRFLIVFSLDGLLTLILRKFRLKGNAMPRAQFLMSSQWWCIPNNVNG